MNNGSREARKILLLFPLESKGGRGDRLQPPHETLTSSRLVSFWPIVSLLLFASFTGSPTTLLLLPPSLGLAHFSSLCLTQSSLACLCILFPVSLFVFLVSFRLVRSSAVLDLQLFFFSFTLSLC